MKTTALIEMCLVVGFVFVEGQEPYDGEQIDFRAAPWVDEGAGVEGIFENGEMRAMLENRDVMAENADELNPPPDVELQERAAGDEAVGIGLQTYFCGEGWYCCGGSCCPLKTSCIQNRCYNVTDVDAVETTSTCSKCDLMTLSITADNSILELYLDGTAYPLNTQPYRNTWNVPSTFLIPAGTKVIAVRAQDYGGSGSAGGLLASINHDYLLSNSYSWKCTSSYYTNWMSPDYSDSHWSAASAYANNPDTYSANGRCCSTLSPISTNAKWIWTGRYRYPSLDTIVYCRGQLPTNGCDVGYGSACTRQCQRQGKTCCHCDMLSQGPTQVCSCCPAGYACCGPTFQKTYTCCPVEAKCHADKPGKCTTWKLAPTRGSCPSTPKP